MKHVDIDIHVLRCFEEVAKSGSITKAGAKFGLTESAMSVKMKRLERHLQASLFDRKHRHLSLTYEGEILLEYARRILPVHDETLQRLSDLKQCGSLRIGLTDYAPPDLLPKVLSGFMGKYPNIHFDVQTGVGLSLIKIFEKRELDLVVSEIDEYDGEFRLLVHEPLVWVVGRDTNIFDTGVVHLVLPPIPSSIRRTALDRLNTFNCKWEVVFTCNSIASIQAAVQNGMGLSILPTGALNEHLIEAPSELELPELPDYLLGLIIDEAQSNTVRDLFTSYIETEIENTLSVVV
jgi:DNA-binding transcriptional LysR family regulator